MKKIEQTDGLYPCPLCRSRAITCYNGTKWEVKCTKCGANLQPPDEDSPESAEAYWNKRYLDTVQV